VEGIRASISIPALFAVAKLQGRYLVDGGLVNPVPVSVLKEMGADSHRVVGIEVASLTICVTSRAWVLTFLLVNAFLNHLTQRNLASSRHPYQQEWRVPCM